MFDPAGVQGEFQIIQNSFSWSAQTQQRIATANPNRVILYASAYGAQSWGFFLGTGLQLPIATWNIYGNGNIMWTWQNDAILSTLEWWAEPTPPLATGNTRVSTCEVWFKPTE